MHDERHRVTLAGHVTGRLDDIGIDGFAVRAGKGELLGFAERPARESIGIDPWQFAQFAALDRDGVQLGWRFQRGQGEHDVALPDAEAVHMPGPGQHRGLTGFHVDGPQRMLTELVGRGINDLAVGGVSHGIDGSVPGVGQCAPRTRLAIQQHDREAVRFESRAFHRAPGERAAVGRVERLRIPGGVIGGQVARLAALRRHFIDVEVRRPGLRLAFDARVERNRRAVGREGVLGGVAERLRRYIGIQHAREGNRIAGHRAVLQIEHEQARQPLVVPGIPVPHENTVVGRSAAGLLASRVGRPCRQSRHNRQTLRHSPPASRCPAPA